MRVTAVVPATDDPQHISACLVAIATADPPPDEVLIVQGPGCPGAACARNAGAAAASGDVVVFVDSDVVVHPDTFRRLRSAFEAEPSLDALFGSYDDRADGTVVSGFRNLLHHAVHQASAGEAVTFWSAIGAVRRPVFVASGGFDAARYPGSSIEDIELGVRLVQAGARIRLDPAIQGTHLKSWTLRSMVTTDLCRRAIPWISLLLRTCELPTTLNLSWRHRAGALAATMALVAAAVRRPAAALAAVAAMAALNTRFLALLYRRGGLRLVGPGVLLLFVHYLTGVAAVPLGFAVWAFAERSPAAPRVAPPCGGMDVTRLAGGTQALMAAGTGAQVRTPVEPVDGTTPAG